MEYRGKIRHQKFTTVGLIDVTRRNKATGEVVPVMQVQNVLVDNFFLRMLDLLDQQAGFQPVQQRIASMWIESDNPGLPPATGTDEGPDVGSTILLQHVFDPADRIQLVVSTSIGPLNGLQLRASIDGDVYAGSTVYAAGLYTRGIDDTPPNPATWTPGDDNVYLVARQLVGPLPIAAGFVIDLAWTIAGGRLPDDLI